MTKLLKQYGMQCTFVIMANEAFFVYTLVPNPDTNSRYLGAIGAIWGLPGILWYLWARYFYLGDILGLFRLTRARVFQGYSGAM